MGALALCVGKAASFDGALRDLAALLHSAKASGQRAPAARLELMANMGHEIRTPMNGILGMTELLLATPLDERQRRFAKAVYRSGEALLETVNNILDLSAIEAGRLELTSSAFDPVALVHETLAMLRTMADDKGLVLSLVESTILPARVRADALRLRQVLAQLVTNAIKFSERGAVAIELGLLEGLTEGEPQQLVCRVRDSGIGIPPEALPRLFRADPQVHSGLARRYGGNGIGLALARRLVGLMGGEITVESAPGLGSEFTFSVRIETLAPEPPARAAPARTASALQQHVLVVEDNPVNQEVIGQMLRAAGCRVHVAAGALTALRAMCEWRFDLVLMDIEMPGMDGAEALRWLRRGPGRRFAFITSAETPVIAVTANAFAGDEARFLGFGFNAYLPKPFRQSQLIDMLNRYLPPSATLRAPQASDPGTQGGAAPTILDANALQRLRDLDPTGANNLMQRIAQAFETSVTRLLPQLQTAQATGDLAGIHHVAHTLKSSSASIGAMRLSQLCAETEAMARDGRTDDMPAKTAAVAAEVANALDALKRMLGNPP